MPNDALCALMLELVLCHEFIMFALCVLALCVRTVRCSWVSRRLHLTLTSTVRSYDGESIRRERHEDIMTDADETELLLAGRYRQATCRC